jgi:hypothetical protein
LDHEYEVCLCMYMPLTCFSGAAKSHSWIVLWDDLLD